MLQKVKDLFGYGAKKETKVEYAKGRNVEGGLRVLEHLGLGLTEAQEKKAFIGCWEAEYRQNEHHFLSTVCGLYSILPFAVVLGSIDEEVRIQREAEFTQRVHSMDMENWMSE